MLCCRSKCSLCEAREHWQHQCSCESVWELLRVFLLLFLGLLRRSWLWMFRCLRLHLHFHSCPLSSRSQWPFTSKHHFSFPRGAPSQDHFDHHKDPRVSQGDRSLFLSLARFLQISDFPLRNARLPSQKEPWWWTVRQTKPVLFISSSQFMWERLNQYLVSVQHHTCI